jgi:hypothetical protein
MWCFVLPWVDMFCLSATMMSMVYLSSPSDSGGFRCRGNLSWTVCGGHLYGRSRVGKCAISRCLASRDVSEDGIVFEIVCESKCCRCDLCSGLCRACEARKRRRCPASAADGFPHVLSPRSSSDGLSYGGSLVSPCLIIASTSLRSCRHTLPLTLLPHQRRHLPILRLRRVP